MKRLGFIGGVSAGVACATSAGSAQSGDRFAAGATPIEGDSICFWRKRKAIFRVRA